MQPVRTSATKLTYDDFLLSPDDRRRHELLDGNHYVTPSPNTRHQRISRRLLLALGRFLETHPLGKIFCAPSDVVLSDFDVVKPDLIYVAAEQSDVIADKPIRGTPTLVIEILSPGTRKTDEQTRRRLFARVRGRPRSIAGRSPDSMNQPTTYRLRVARNCRAR